MNEKTLAERWMKTHWGHEQSAVDDGEDWARMRLMRALRTATIGRRRRRRLLVGEALDPRWAKFYRTRAWVYLFSDGSMVAAHAPGPHRSFRRMDALGRDGFGHFALLDEEESLRAAVEEERADAVEVWVRVRGELPGLTPGLRARALRHPCAAVRLAAIEGLRDTS